jgi:ferredoxin, 2Fe-2S
MPKVIYVEHSGTEHVVQAKPGQSVMEAAVKNNVPGIDADCGGACACATCHVYVEDTWKEKVGGISETEAAMLEFAPGVDSSSRLSCQIRVTEDLDGLIVRLPQSQH